LHKLGLVDELRRVPAEKIQLKEIAEKQRQLELQLNAKAVQLPERTYAMLQIAQERLRHAVENWERRKTNTCWLPRGGLPRPAKKSPN